MHLASIDLALQVLFSFLSFFTCNTRLPTVLHFFDNGGLAASMFTIIRDPTPILVDYYHSVDVDVT
jgi:hypothetical protein